MAVTLAEIVDGSAEINRMRAEINMIVLALSGFISAVEYGKDTGPITLTERSSRCNVSWKLVWQNSQIMNCRVWDEGDSEARLYVVAAGRALPFMHVSEIYKSLPSLVARMAKRFPSVRKRLAVLQAAAKSARDSIR